MRNVPDREAAALYYEVQGMTASARRQRRDNTTAGPARTGRFQINRLPLTQVRRPLPNYLQQILAAARQVQDWQEQSLRDLRAKGYEVEEFQDSLIIRSRDVHPGPLTAAEYRAAVTELQHRLNNPEATEQGAADELAAALTPEYLRNLQTELDDLEEQDPEVADAMASYDRMVKDVTGRVPKARFPRNPPIDG